MSLSKGIRPNLVQFLHQLLQVLLWLAGETHPRINPALA